MLLVVILCGLRQDKTHLSKMNGFALIHTRIPPMVCTSVHLEEVPVVLDPQLSYTKWMMMVPFISRDCKREKPAPIRSAQFAVHLASRP